MTYSKNTIKTRTLICFKANNLKYHFNFQICLFIPKLSPCVRLYVPKEFIRSEKKIHLTNKLTPLAFG